MDIEQLKAMADSLHNKYRKSQDEGYGNLKGLENVLKSQQPDMNEIDQLERGVQPSSGTAAGYCHGGMPGYAQGGVVNDLPDSTIQFDPTMGLPPAPPPPPTIAPNVPSSPVQAPNPVNQYLDSQKQQLSKYGPAEQLALSNSLINQRQSLPGRAPVALGGLADALTRVGGGQSNYGGQIQDQQNRLAGEQTSALEKAGTQNIAQVEANQKLDSMDPRSPLSKAAQQAWSGVLLQTGLKPEQIANMSVSNIAGITGQSVDIIKAKAEASMAAATLGLKTQEAAQTAKHQTAEEAHAMADENIKTAEDRRKNLQTLTSPINALLHPLNAWSASKELNSIATPSNVPDNRITVLSPTGQLGHIPKEKLQAAISQGYKVQ